MATITNSDKKYLLESWKRNIRAVTDVRDNFDNASKLNFARVLENTKNVMRERGIRNEGLVRGGVTQMSDVSWFPDHVMSMVSALYASQIAEDLVSVQPLDSPLGVILFLQYLYGDTRGDNLSGRVMIDEWGAMKNGESRNNYASGLIDGEPINATSTEVEAHLQNLPLLIDASHPIDFVDSSNSGDQWRLRRVGEKAYTLKALNASGYEEGADILDHEATISVEPESGLVAFKTKAPMAASLNARYTQDLSSGPSMAGRVTLRLRSEQMKAEPHKLRANYVFDAGYGLSKTHGLDIEESLINACTAEIRQERDNEVINLLRRQAGHQSTWDRTNTNYISLKEHDESFIAELFACGSQIFESTKRVFGNWCVVGKKGLDILNSVGRPRFEPNYVVSPNGPYVAGVLDNKMKVICSPYINSNEYIVGFKGDTFVDAGFVLGDYLPIASTDFIMLDDFVGRKGFVSYYGTRMLNPNMYVRGTITGV